MRVCPHAAMSGCLLGHLEKCVCVYVGETNV